MDQPTLHIVRKAIARADLAAIASRQFRSRGVESEAIRERIRTVVRQLLSDA